MEKNEKFEARLKYALRLIHDLKNDEGVLSGTALYGFLLSADFALSAALSRVCELDCD